MHLDKFYSMVPLERYRGIVVALALSDEHHSQDDDFWLQFAAQIAVLCAQPPNLLADQIHVIARDLRKDSHWYQILASPARFVISALLVQYEITPEDFIAADQRLSAMLHEADLHPTRFHEILTVLVLLMSHRNNLLCRLEIDRLKAIYGSMMHAHWWLTDAEDIPGCAALAQCPGSVDGVMAQFETAFHQLRTLGLSGEGLQIAAILTVLCGVDMTQTMRRFRDLLAALDGHPGGDRFAHEEALVMLTLLDQEPQVVIGRLLALDHELAEAQSKGSEKGRLLLCANLTLFDLVRFDAHLCVDTAAGSIEAMRKSIRTYFLASVVLLSRIEPDNRKKPPS